MNPAGTEWRQWLTGAVSTRLRRANARLASGNAPFDHAILGILAGLLAGTLVLIFRIAFEWAVGLLHPDIKISNATFFASPPWWFFFVFPALGATLVGIALSLVPKNRRQVGLTHVVLHVQQRDGNLPWQNAVIQFFGGLACFVTGQSVGREGPAVHLGVAINSWVGQLLKLPHNTLRVLAGCGTAAAIAASFNTPIAGVIFAMEVVLAEYTIAGFTPVILAAVSGTVVVRLFYGNAPFLPLQQVLAPELWDLGFVLLLGIGIAFASTAFVSIQRGCLRFSERPVWLRLAVAGIVTGALGLLEPTVLGSGYINLRQLLAEPAAPLALAGIIAAKLIATSISIGLGMPGGMISPCLFIGACIGALTGILVNMLVPDLSGSIALYTLLGMAAMMAALLNAPLAALMALIELTYSPNIIFPGLLAITVANICHRDLFSQASAIDTVLRHQGINPQYDPIRQTLQSQGVSSLMNTRVAIGRRAMTSGQLQALLGDDPDWIVLLNDKAHYIANTVDLVDPLAVRRLLDRPRSDAAEVLDLRDLRLTVEVAAIDTRANLYEAWRRVLKNEVGAVCVRAQRRYLGGADIGIITRSALERHLYHRDGTLH